MSYSVKPSRSWSSMIASHAICWLVLFMLSSCGGGTSSASLPGTGGTGITAMGPVTGFGSVIVNGTRFEDSTAQVQIDGAIEKSSALRLGMTAKIVGLQFNSAASDPLTTSTLSKANSIELWSISQGTIKGIQAPRTVTVAGMSLVVDAGTVFDGVESLATLNPSAVIKVWGQPSSADFSHWTITRLEVLKAPQNTITTGKVSVRGSKLVLNGMTLVNAPVGLIDGQLIRVMGTLSGTTEVILTASQTTVLAEAGSTTASTGYTELQGLVSGILSTSTVAPHQATRLTLGASEVDMSLAIVTPLDTIIMQGMRIQVQGVWSNGVLVASRVKAISDQELKAVEVEGVIESLVGVSNFTVRGQRFDASAIATEEQAGQLSVGSKVYIVGAKKGSFVTATRLNIL